MIDLSPRESHAFVLRTLGVEPGLIARQMKVTLSTVKSYISKVQKKLTAKQIRIEAPKVQKQTTESSSPFEELKRLAKEAGLKTKNQKYERHT